MSKSSQRKRAQQRARANSQMARRNSELGVQSPPPGDGATTAFGMLQLQKSWQGPIPSPEDLEHYARIDPALPGQIIAMAERGLVLAENQQSHRITQEDRQVRGLNRRADVGLYMAFILALVMIGGGFWLIHDGHDWAGSGVIGVDLVALVSVFVYGRHDQARFERDQQQPPHGSGPQPRRRRRR